MSKNGGNGKLRKSGPRGGLVESECVPTLFYFYSNLNYLGLVVHRLEIVSTPVEYFRVREAQKNRFIKILKFKMGDVQLVRLRIVMVRISSSELPCL